MDTGNTKDEVRALLDRLPDDVELEDALYHLYVQTVLTQRLAVDEPVETVPHQQVADEFRQRWLSHAR